MDFLNYLEQIFIGFFLVILLVYFIATLILRYPLLNIDIKERRKFFRAYRLFMTIVAGTFYGGVIAIGMLLDQWLDIGVVKFLNESIFSFHLIVSVVVGIATGITWVTYGNEHEVIHEIPKYQESIFEIL